MFAQSASPDTEEIVLLPISEVRGASTIVGDYASILGARLLSVLLSIATIIVTTRILDPSGFGTVAYVTILATLIFTIGSAWTSAAVPRYGREEFDEHGSMVAVTWERLIITAPLVVAVAAAILAIDASDLLSKNLGAGFLIVACFYGVALVLSDHLVYVLQAVGRMKLSALAVLLRHGCVLAALGIILITGVSRSPLTVASVIAAAWIVLTPALAFSVWEAGVWPPRFNAKLRKRMLLFSLPLIAFTVSQYAIQAIDFFVIGIFRGTADVGRYYLAYQGYTVLQSVATAAIPILTTLFVSLRAAGREDLIRTFISRGLPQLMFLSAVATGLIASIIPIALPVVFGSKYSGSVLPFVVLLIPILLLVASNVLAPVILLHEATRGVGLINIIAASINIAGDFILIGPVGMGIVGAAIATTASISCVFFGYCYLVVRRLELRFWLNPLISLPLLVGVGAALLLPAFLAVLSGPVLVVLTAIIVVTWADIFRAEDSELVNRLNLPSPLKRIAIKAITIASRP